MKLTMWRRYSSSLLCAEKSVGRRIRTCRDLTAHVQVLLGGGHIRPGRTGCCQHNVLVGPHPSLTEIRALEAASSQDGRNLTMVEMDLDLPSGRLWQGPNAW